MEKLYTLKEIAKTSGFSEQYLRKLCRESKVAHTRKGSRFFFTAEEAAHLIVHVAVIPVVEPPIAEPKQ
jgi:hypothetical protein